MSSGCGCFKNANEEAEMVNQYTKRVLAAGAVAVAAVSEAAVFPLSSGDIADKVAWGGELPGSGETVTFSNGVYTASADVEFGVLERVYNTRNQPNTMIIDQTEYDSVKVRFSGFRPAANVVSPAHTNWFKGGWFDFGKGEVRFDKNLADGWANANNQCFVITDSAMVTNISGMTLYGTSSTGSKMLVDGASLYVDGHVVLSGYGQASDSEILVTNGGLLRQTGRLLLTEGIASANRKSIAYFTTNRLVVAGKGSSYVGLGSPAVSTGGNGDFILVTDGAYFSGSVHFGIGNKLSTNNLMRVEGGARADITEVRLCASEVDGLAGGRFEILDGAVVSNDNFLVGAYASGAMANGAAGCSLLVSNATFVTKFLSIGQGPAGSNNTVVISGSSAKFDHVTTSASQWTYFGGGRHCLFQIENDATVEWRYQNGWSYNTPVSNCTVRIKGGGKLKREGNFHTGSDRNLYSAGNRIEILDGGILDVSGWIKISGEEGTIVVSNGTLTARELVVGAEQPTGALKGCGLMIVDGVNPKISVTNGAFSVINSSVLRYNFAGGAYSSVDYAPVEVKGAAVFDSDSSIEIENVDAVRSCGFDSLTLLKASSISVSDEILKAAESQMGEGVRLRTVEDDGGVLLQLRFSKGLAISIR